MEQNETKNEEQLNTEQEVQQEVQNTAEEQEKTESQETSEEAKTAEDNSEAQAEEPHEPTPEERIAELEEKNKSLRDEYLRLMADFENFRKRTATDKQNLIKYGAENTIKALLPVIDDFDRAIQHNEKVEDAESLREGFKLIYQKFQKFLSDSQVTEIPAAQGDAFDESVHDAMTMFPAPDESLKGKIIDCPTKGYKLYDKVIRFAKVVVGQ